MLKPFRIRNLYFNTTDLVDCSGIVQISPQQYDQEIHTTAEALIAYTDEDDGETITVSLANVCNSRSSHQMYRLALPLNWSNDFQSRQVDSQAGMATSLPTIHLHSISLTSGNPRGPQRHGADMSFSTIRHLHQWHLSRLGQD